MEKLSSEERTSLETALSEARKAWPNVSLEEDEVIAFILDKLPEDEPAGPALGRLRIVDMYLACACAKGDEVAIRRCHDHVMQPVRAALHNAAQGAMIDEVMSNVMAKLFIGIGDNPAAIGGYGGRGKLTSWAQVIAVREAHNVHRKRGREPKKDELDEMVAGAISADDPALEKLKDTYRAQFKQAFAVAFEELTAKQRSVLRYHYLDGLNIDEIGALLGVHRATVARWRSAARGHLFENTKRHFRKEMDIESAEFGSVMRLIESQLDVSLVRLVDELEE